MKARILWVEGKRANSPSFVPGLRKKDFQIEVVPTGNAALETLLIFDPDVVIVNAASLRTSGKRICKELRGKVSNLPIIVISQSDETSPEQIEANVVLHLPFTARKLLNRIIPLLPADETQILHAGPIRLNLRLKKVRCLGREARLTPRLVRLLQILTRPARRRSMPRGSTRWPRSARR